MKLLFNLEVIEDNRVKARPSDYLKSLSATEQEAAVTEFLAWEENEVNNNEDPQAKAEAEIGVATATEYLQKQQSNKSRIYTGTIRGNHDDKEDR